MRTRAILAGVLGLVMAGPCLADQGGPGMPEKHFLPTRSAAILSTRPRLILTLNRLLSRSALFSRAAARLAARGRHVSVVARREVPWDRLKHDPDARFTNGSAAAAVPLRDDDGRVRNFMVVIDFALLDRLNRRRHPPRHDIEQDITRLLIHEIYGHAMPRLLYGASGRCLDPQPGELPLNACSIRRENRVREELGLGRRIDYGLGSLAMSRSGDDSRF